MKNSRPNPHAAATTATAAYTSSCPTSSTAAAPENGREDAPGRRTSLGRPGHRAGDRRRLRVLVPQRAAAAATKAAAPAAAPSLAMDES